jgi:hypothetical protein
VAKSVGIVNIFRFDWRGQDQCGTFRRIWRALELKRRTIPLQVSVESKWKMKLHSLTVSLHLCCSPHCNDVVLWPRLPAGHDETRRVVFFPLWRIESRLYRCLIHKVMGDYPERIRGTICSKMPRNDSHRLAFPVRFVRFWAPTCQSSFCNGHVPNICLGPRWLR